MTAHTPLSDDPQMERVRARVGIVLQDKWRLDAVLGVGGMAAVYAATHRNGKRVAVKMLHAEFSHDREVRERFLQEGYAANTIQHEGAVSVLDDDLAPDGSAFLVMELLEGETLEQRWENAGRRLPVNEVLSIVDQVLDVLAAAHAKSVVHRDVKPENLFLTKTGALKVLDFGIAKVFERERVRPSSTRIGMVMGTPAFMAPEQARARWDEVDGRTDLWAVGATMFTLLSGRHVHEAPSTQEELIMSATTVAPSLGGVAPALPDSLVEVVDHALAFDRAARWQDARSMQQAVRAVLEALGGGEPAASSGRTAIGAMMVSGPRRGTVPGGVATTLDMTGKTSGVAAWAREREVRLAETARLRASIADLQQRLAGARKHVGQVQTQVDVGRAERTSLEQWFQRQVGTRTAAVEEARHVVRRQAVAVARHAIADRAGFGAELDPAREQIARLERAAVSAARDVTVHTAALEAYDPRSLRIGLCLLVVAALFAVALVVAPIVWRATRVIYPPSTTSQPARSPGR